MRNIVHTIEAKVTITLIAVGRPATDAELQAAVETLEFPDGGVFIDDDEICLMAADDGGLEIEILKKQSMEEPV